MNKAEWNESTYGESGRTRLGAWPGFTGGRENAIRA